MQPLPLKTTSFLMTASNNNKLLVKNISNSVSSNQSLYPPFLSKAERRDFLPVMELLTLLG